MWLFTEVLRRSESNQLRQTSLQPQNDYCQNISASIHRAKTSSRLAFDDVRLVPSTVSSDGALVTARLNAISLVQWRWMDRYERAVSRAYALALVANRATQAGPRPLPKREGRS
jgi:hypothetical protein